MAKATLGLHAASTVSDTSLVIREALALDADAISSLLIRSFANDLAGEHSPEFTLRMVELWTPEHVGRLLTNRYTLVACLGDQVVGAASLYENSIRMVAVRSDHHRRGVGTALMRRLIARAASTIPVLTVQSTLLAERFYGKLGFVKQQEHCVDGQRYIIMQLMLRGSWQSGMYEGS